MDTELSELSDDVDDVLTDDVVIELSELSDDVELDDNDNVEI